MIEFAKARGSQESRLVEEEPMSVKATASMTRGQMIRRSGRSMLLAAILLTTATAVWGGDEEPAADLRESRPQSGIQRVLKSLSVDANVEANVEYSAPDRPLHGRLNIASGTVYSTAANAAGEVSTLLINGEPF